MAMVEALLSGTDRWRTWTALWLVALGAVVAGIASGHPGLGLHGRSLVALALTVLAAAAWVGWLVGVVVALPSVSMASLATLVVTGSLLTGMSPGSPALALCAIGVFIAALTLRRTHAIALTAAGIVAVGVAALACGQDLTSLAGYAAALVGITLGGFSRRQHRTRLMQAELLVAQARRLHEQHARAAALGERARIAREIHDVLAHSLGALAVQLEAADALLSEDRGPDRARTHVTRARRLAVEGLTETRRAIEALRGQALPLPDLLTALAADHQADTGASARLSVQGTPRPLAPDAALAAYRTAQEAATNVRKHASGAPVRLNLDYRHDEVVLTITDYPSSASAPRPGALAETGGGYGLAGLRERAELIGGALSAGPGPGGWTVRLRLPA